MHTGAGACIFKHKKLEKDDLLFSGNHTSSCTLQEFNLYAPCKSPLAGGGGIVWQSHCRPHRMSQPGSPSCCSSMCQSTEGKKYHIPWTTLPQTHLWSSNIVSLTTKGCWLPWGGLSSLSHQPFDTNIPFITHKMIRKSTNTHHRLEQCFAGADNIGGTEFIAIAVLGMKRWQKQLQFTQPCQITANDKHI